MRQRAEDEVAARARPIDAVRSRRASAGRTARTAGTRRASPGRRGDRRRRAAPIATCGWRSSDRTSSEAAYSPTRQRTPIFALEVHAPPTCRTIEFRPPQKGEGRTIADGPERGRKPATTPSSRRFASASPFQGEVVCTNTRSLITPWRTTKSRARRARAAPPPTGSRGEIGELEMPPRHRENAGDERHRGAQRPEEAADEDGEHAPAADEGLALGKQIGMARQRPAWAMRSLKLKPIQ